MVSNHLPEEVVEALDLLKQSGVQVKRIGLPEASRRLTPSDIDEADAVMTIGKTVQYAFRSGCPVYIYDHFFGPGWLTPTNCESAEYFNFSGRCTPVRKSAQQLFGELSEVSREALDAVAECPKRFELELWIDRFIELASFERSHRRLEFDSENAPALLLACEGNSLMLVDSLYESSERYREAYQTCSAYAETARLDNVRLHVVLEETVKQNAALQTEIERYRNAYHNESAKSATYLSDVERFHNAYREETLKHAKVQLEVERLQGILATLKATLRGVLAVADDPEDYHI